MSNLKLRNPGSSKNRTKKLLPGDLIVKSNDFYQSEAEIIVLNSSIASNYDTI